MSNDLSWLKNKTVDELVQFREDMRQEGCPIIALECTFELNSRGYYDACSCQDNAGDDPECPLHGDLA